MTNSVPTTAPAPPDYPTRCRPTRWGAVLLSCLCLLLLTLPGQAKGPIEAAGPLGQIRYVKPGGTGNGFSWAGASGDLQAMITASSTGDQVWVAKGLYKPTTGTSRTISFAMKEGVAIYGGFVGTETALDQRPAVNPTTGMPSSTTLSGDIGTPNDNSDNSYHVICNKDINSTAVLDGVVITGGNANHENENSDEARGGGICNITSSPTITNCSLQNNSATNFGGGVYNFTSSPTITNCSIQNNSTVNIGGGIGNLYFCNPTITNCSLQSNSATQGGGGICDFFACSSTITNCSLLNNSGGAGGGVVVVDASTTNLTNCVIWGNGAANTFASFKNEGIAPPVLTVTYSLFDDTVTGYTGSNNKTTTTSPFASANSVVLAPNSPAINAGNLVAYQAVNGPTTDLAGNPRIVDGKIDMGAVELQTAPVRPIRYVKATGTGDGSSWASASGNLQAMIDATGVTQVWVAAGTYKPSTAALADPREASFVMKNGVTIYGGFAGTETSLSERPAVNPTTGMPSSTTLSGDIGTPNDKSDNSYHVVANMGNGLDNTAVLDGVVITGGNASSTDGSINGVGGGILNNQTGSPTFVNCTLINNSAAFNGGGIWNGNGAAPILTNCIVQSNSATQGGGGVYNINSSNPTLTNCSLQSNSSAQGGGMLNAASSPTLTNCSLQNNSATQDGGGMYNVNSSNPTLTNCSLQTNSANKGGGIANATSSPKLTNCSLLSNTATNGGGGGIYNTSNSKPVLVNCSLLNNRAAKGGGLYANASSFTLVNCSLLSNTATAAGGGIFTTTGSNATLANCVLWNNGAGNTLYKNQSTLTATYSLFDDTVTGYTGSNNKTTTTSPFASVGVVLAPNSPAINAGSNAAYTTANGPTTDLAGNPRLFPANGTIDMGAIESQTIPVLTLTPSATPTVVCVGSPASLSVEVSSGTAPYSYTWVAPVGITLSATNTKMISATPTATGVQTLTVLVSDNSSPALSASATVELTANASPDYQPLVDLYNATNGPNWSRKAGWLSSCDPCKGSDGDPWQGIFCKDGRVVTVLLDNNQLAGSLPTSLSALSSLQYLALRNNQLTGSIPTSLSTLTSLNSLLIDNNQLTGSIPTSLSALTNLQNLYLNNNQLTGSIPASLSALTNIQNLNLSANQLTGGIPAGFSTLSKLDNLSLNNNQLSGGIPASWGNFKLGESTINLSNNQLSGCLPTALKALCSMGADIRISGNPGLPGGGDWGAFCSGAANGNCVIALQTSATPNPVMAGNAATLSVTPSGATAPYSYTWAAPPGITLTAANQAQTLAPIPAGTSGVLTFTITVADATPLTSYSLVTLTVNSASPATQTACRSSQVVLNSGLSGVRYEWYRGGRTAANKLVNVQGVQVGTSTASLTLVSVQTKATFYCKAIGANGSVAWSEPFTVEINFGCNGRVGTTEPETALQVRVAPNPLEGDWLRATVTGAAGQALQMQLVDMLGTPLRTQQWDAAQTEEGVEWNLSGQAAGLYLLQVRTPQQSQTIRIVKP